MDVTFLPEVRELKPTNHSNQRPSGGTGVWETRGEDCQNRVLVRCVRTSGRLPTLALQSDGAARTGAKLPKSPS